MHKVMKLWACLLRLSEPRRIYIGTAQLYSSMRLQGGNKELEIDRHVALWLAGNPPARHWALLLTVCVELGCRRVRAYTRPFESDS